MRASENWILRASARQHYWRGSAGFSLKRFTRGQAHYQIDNVRRRVDEGHLLIVNAGQEYTIEIDALHPVTSHCIFFRSDVVATALKMRSPLGEHPLDVVDSEGTFEFSPHLRPLDGALCRQLERFEGQILAEGTSALIREERYQQLAAILVSFAADQTPQSLRAIALKPSTRRELLRRVRLARDYIISHWEEPLLLQRIGRAAGLSQNHLLRSFRAVFGHSPGSFQQRIRLQNAERMLRCAAPRITDIALQCGFNSLPSFSRLFRRQYGMGPQAFRKKVRSDK